MILIVILIVALFGLAPFGLDDPGPESHTRMFGTATMPQPARLLAKPLHKGCQDPGAFLLVEQGDAVIAIDPLTQAGRAVPVEPDVVRVVERGWRMLHGAVPAPWHVVRTSEASSRRIAAYDGQSGAQIFDVAFARRIELSTAVASPSGRFTVHVQANNVASEITVLDAGRGAQWRRYIRHDARLAAYAIGVAFSPNGSCAAILMEREGVGPETWLLDLESETLSDPLVDAFALGWVRRQV